MSAKAKRSERARGVAAPLVAAVAIVAISVALWVALERQQTRQIRDATNLAATSAAREFAKSMEFRGRGLAALAEHWRPDDLSAAETHRETALYFTQYRYCELVAWVDAQGRVRWADASAGATPEWLGQMLAAGFAPTRNELWTARSPVAGKFVTTTVAWNRGITDGVLVAGFDARAYADSVLQNISPNYQIRIVVDGRELYDRKDGAPREAQWQQTVTNEANGWVVSAWPGKTVLARQHSRLPLVVLLSGIVVAGLLGSSLYLRQASTRQAANSSRLAAIVTSTNDAILSMALDGTVQTWNRGAEQLYGYTAEEMVGHSIARLIPPESKDEFDGCLQRIARGGGIDRHPTVRVRKDGSRVEVSLTLSPIQDAAGRVMAACSIVRDITEQQRAERELRRLNEALQRERQRLRDVLDMLPAYVVLLSRDYGVPFANRYFEQNFGSSEGRRCYEYLFQRSAPCENCETFKVFETCAAHQWKWVGPNGRNYDVYDFPFADDDGARLILEMGIDVTERVQAEAALQRYAAELQRSNSELQDFASIASHDLQEPLRKINAFGERLRLHAGAQLDATGRDYLERMEKASERMSTLIGQLLEYSRVTTKARPFERVDLQTTLFEVVADVEARIRSSGGRVVAGPMPWVEADRVQVRELLQNLLANALKFHVPGKPPQVEVEARRQGAWVELVVRDHGIGFDERHLDRIFRPFQRLHSRSEFEGTGMGLAICRKIAARHGGSIAAHSRLGEGSEFLVRLPAVRQPEGSV